MSCSTVGEQAPCWQVCVEYILPLRAVGLNRSLAREKNSIATPARQSGPRSFERARTEGSVDLEVALLAERRARGPD